MIPRADLYDRVLTRAESHGVAYSLPEVTVRGHRLPSDYWEVVRTVDGFVTGGGFFRLFRVQGPDGLQARNETEWLKAYGHLVNGFVCVAEDIFGDLYGYVFDDAGASTLSKFYCEGGAFEACVPSDFGDFLATRVLIEDSDTFDADLARAAWRRGFRPSTSQHLAFTIPLIVGGEYDLDNLGVEPVSLHLGLLGQLTLELMERPDGTPIIGFTGE